MSKKLLNNLFISLICLFAFCEVSAMKQDGFGVSIQNKLTEAISVVVPTDKKELHKAVLQELGDDKEFSFININAGSEHHVSASVEYDIPDSDKELARFPLTITPYKEIGVIILSYSVDCSRMVVSFASLDAEHDVSLRSTKFGGGGIDIVVQKKEIDISAM